MRAMLAPVVADVVDGTAHFGWRAQDVRVVAVAEHAPLSAHDDVEPFSHADGDALDAAAERTAVMRLDQQVQAVPLHRELREAQAELVRAGVERLFDYREAAARA